VLSELIERLNVNSPPQVQKTVNVGFTEDKNRSLRILLQPFDLLMLPTSEPAGKLEPVPPSSLFTRASFTTPFNVGGNPALSVCSGFDARGLPFSLQIVGKLFDEATVLRAGDAYEKATPWRAKRPAL